MITGQWYKINSVALSLKLLIKLNNYNDIYYSVRFGSFEIFKPPDPLTGYKGPSSGRDDVLHQLLGYTIKNFYPQVCV